MKNIIRMLFVCFSLASLSAADLPDWYPSSYDLEEAKKAAAEILRLQRQPINDGKRIKKIVFSDADHTLLKTQTPILLRNKKTGQLFRDPKTNMILRLPNRKFLEALQTLKSRYPDQRWDQFEIDFDEMGSIVAIDVTAPIENVIDILKCISKTGDSKEFIITARSSLAVPAAFEDYFRNLGLEIDGTFAVNNPQIEEKLKLRGFSAARKKALTMAALTLLFSPQEVSFYDDGDDNLRMAMCLLPALFPDIYFRFYDIIHVGGNCFRIYPVAYSKKGGDLISFPDNKLLSARQIETYSSKDAPLPDEM